MSEIKIKKGEKFRIHTCCHMLGSDSYEDEVAQYDMTQKDLDELAWQAALDTIQPEGWWEKIDE